MSVSTDSLPDAPLPDAPASDAEAEVATPSGRSKPWTLAMEAELADGDWHSHEKLVQIGMAHIPDDRAGSEAPARRDPDGAAPSPEEDARRLDAGRRTVAGQSIMGMRRFGKVEVRGKTSKQVRLVSGGAASLGVLAERVAALEGAMQGVLERTDATVNLCSLMYKRLQAHGIDLSADDATADDATADDAPVKE